MYTEEPQADPAVPRGFISTGLAIREVFEHYKPSPNSHAADHGIPEGVEAQASKFRHRLKASRLPVRELEDLILEAIEREELEVVVFDVQSDWREITVPTEHWCKTVSGADSVHSGLMLREDFWPQSLPSHMVEAPVCFRADQWNAWMQRNSAYFGEQAIDRALEVPSLREKDKHHPLVDAWYTERVRNHPPDRPSPSRVQDEMDAKREFEGLKYRKLYVRAARKKYAPKRWKEAGAKGKKIAAHQQEKAAARK